jgi:predicted dehydrogenase
MAVSAPLRAAIIGCGGISEDHAAGWHRLKEARIAAYCDCALNRKQPVSSGRDGAKALEIVLAAYRSAEAGRAIELATW